MVENKFYTIDSHCHIYPEKIAQKAVAGTDKFYDTVAFGTGTVQNLVESGEKAGIDHFIVQSVATTPKQVKSINEFIADCVAKSNGKLTGLGTLHPDSVDIKGDVEHLLELGLKGVKLHPDIQQFKCDNDKCMEIYRLCEENNLVMLMHTGDYRYDYSNPDRIRNILNNFKKLTFIGAHLAGWSVWQEAYEKLSGYENLYVDCSSCFGFTDVKQVYELMKKYGADRILFGTDYPMWSPLREMETFLYLDFSDKEREKILGLNAKKVFGIQ
ncbi:MAG: amidohydrolase family protein [Acutalibacteraceae bacterium]|nr:amidohydrolase family protein [Acutalibacteraceae bacterium]